MFRLHYVAKGALNSCDTRFYKHYAPSGARTKKGVFSSINMSLLTERGLQGDQF